MTAVFPLTCPIAMTACPPAAAIADLAAEYMDELRAQPGVGDVTLLATSCDFIVSLSKDHMPIGAVLRP